MDYMERIQRAVEYIEKNLTGSISLQQIAGESFMSPYHFHRVFHGTIGQTVSEYIRERRLTLAAIRLAGTKDRIIDLAFEFGFESQEAFTRAFKKQFGYTPAKYRTLGKNSVLYHRKSLASGGIKHLFGGLTMEPRIVNKDSFRVIGMERTTSLKNNRIPMLWQSFFPKMSEIPHRTGNHAYGICINTAGFDVRDFTDETEFIEMVCVEVSKFESIPSGMVARNIPARKYAVFTHKGDLATLRNTYDYIYGTWLVNSGQEINFQMDEADDFELYDERFNPQDPVNSEFDIYVPIK